MLIPFRMLQNIFMRNYYNLCKCKKLLESIMIFVRTEVPQPGVCYTKYHVEVASKFL